MFNLTPKEVAAVGNGLHDIINCADIPVGLKEGDFEVKGKRLIHVEVFERESISFVFDDGSLMVMYHAQDCCESVWLEDICGDLQDLVGQTIELFEERTEYGEEDEDSFCESMTWTFYTIRCNAATVDLRWCGTSNGYYSERVDIVQCVPSTPLSNHERLTFAGSK